MKVYNKVVIDIKSGEIIEEEAFEYSGPVAGCKSGGGTTTSTNTVTGDPVFNQGLLELYRGDAKTADEYDNFFRYGVFYNPTEKVSGYYDKDGKFIEANAPSVSQSALDYSSNPSQTAATAAGKAASAYTDAQNHAGNNQLVTITRGELEGYDPNTTTGLGYVQESIAAQGRLLPSEEKAALSGNESTTAQNILNTATANAGLSLVEPTTELALSEINQGISFNEFENKERQAQFGVNMREARNTREKLDFQSEAMPLYFDEAINGVNVGERMDMAQADVVQADKGSTRTMRQRAAMTGINPSGASFASGMQNNALNLTRNIATARGTAKTNAENEKFARLQGALTL